jgi:hypothetical protein
MVSYRLGRATNDNGAEQRGIPDHLPDSPVTRGGDHGSLAPRHRKIAVLVLLVAMAVLAGCGEGRPASALPTATSGSVRLHAGASAYHSGDTIVITITNQGASTVYIYNEGTDCGLVGLQRLVNNQWGADGIPICPLLAPLRSFPLAAGASIAARLVPPQGGWVSGEYRASESNGYSLAPNGPNALALVYSAGFTVS